MAKINFATNGKRDLQSLEKSFDSAIVKLHKERWLYDSNRKLVEDYIKAAKTGKAKSAGKNKRVSKASLYRIMGILRLLSENWIQKPFEETTQKDWDRFYDNMEDDKIKNEYSKKFKPSTKAKNYKTVRKFLKWKFGENKFYPSFCDNWVTSEETPTKEFLTRSEVDKMINAASALKVKAYIMMLFDGGFRIEELANLRWTDVKKPEGKHYYRAFVRKETSKTNKERYVSLWLATDLIDSYKNSVKLEIEERNKKKEEKEPKELFKETDFIFTVGYQALRKTIKRIAKKVLGKDISPHTMRHSSATYYSNITKTYQHFCSRYGWSLKSGIAQRYFHGVNDDEVADATKDHEIARFKTEFEKVQIENKDMQEQLSRMNKILQAMANEQKLSSNT